MSTTPPPWTLTRPMRWRIKDWASCLLSCRIPLENEAQTCQDHPIKNMVFELNKESDVTCNNRGGNIKRGSKKLFKRRHRSGKERQLNISSPTSVEYHPQDSSWLSNFPEEDFIVFCFKEDGGLDVVKDGKKEGSDSMQSTTSIRLINRKLKYAADDMEETTNKDSNEEEEHNISSKNEENITPNKQAKEGEEEDISIYWDIESPCDCRSKHEQVEEVESRALLTVESRDSNQSDASTGSFAFPQLRWEWTGSPVEMPKPDEQSTKHRARGLSFQCFSI